MSRSHSWFADHFGISQSATRVPRRGTGLRTAGAGDIEIPAKCLSTKPDGKLHEHQFTPRDLSPCCLEHVRSWDVFHTGGEGSQRYSTDLRLCFFLWIYLWHTPSTMRICGRVFLYEVDVSPCRPTAIDDSLINGWTESSLGNVMTEDKIRPYLPSTPKFTTLLAHCGG